MSEQRTKTVRVLTKEGTPFVAAQDTLPAQRTEPASPCLDRMACDALIYCCHLAKGHEGPHQNEGRKWLDGTMWTAVPNSGSDCPRCPWAGARSRQPCDLLADHDGPHSFETSGPRVMTGVANVDTAANTGPSSLADRAPEESAMSLPDGSDDPTWTDEKRIIALTAGDITPFQRQMVAILCRRIRAETIEACAKVVEAKASALPVGFDSARFYEVAERIRRLANPRSKP